MRALIFLLAITFSHFITINAQNWLTLPKTDSYIYTPSNQFVINKYANEIWFVRDQNVSYLDSDGNIHFLTNSELNSLSNGTGIKFTFTRNGRFFCKKYEGIYKLNELSAPTLLQPITDYYYVLKSNADTIFLTIPFEPYIKIYDNQNLNLIQYGENIFSKNNFFYKSGYVDGNLVRITGPNVDDFIDYFATDPQYLSYFFNDAKFSQKTDTLYVAGNKGISFAYNYDFLDTITPNNTLNMPSANVLEIEFDHLDRLWAVFGDENDKPFSLAMLQEGVWSNYYDASNSPIQFTNSLDQISFKGIETDTLGNVWVCDNNSLHVLNTPTAPAWIVSLDEKNLNTDIKIFPNPSSENITIDFGNLKGNKFVQLFDIKGQLMYEFETNTSNYYLPLTSYSKGVYVLKCINQNAVYNFKLVKE